MDGGHVDADLSITESAGIAMFIDDYAYYRLGAAYRLKGHKAGMGAYVTDPGPANNLTLKFSNIEPSVDDGATGTTVLTDFQMAIGDAELMSNYGRSQYEETTISSDVNLSFLGSVCDIGYEQTCDTANSQHNPKLLTDNGVAYSIANEGWGSNTVNLAGGFNADKSPSDSYASAIAGANHPKQFTADLKQNQNYNGISAISVGIYMPYKTILSCPLTYDDRRHIRIHAGNKCPLRSSPQSHRMGSNVTATVF